MFEKSLNVSWHLVYKIIWISNHIPKNIFSLFEKLILKHYRPSLKKLRRFQTYFKKWWKTCINLYQHHHRVTKYQRLWKWHRHVRTTITSSYKAHVTPAFPTFKTLAWSLADSWMPKELLQVRFVSLLTSYCPPLVLVLFVSFHTVDKDLTLCA